MKRLAIVLLLPLALIVGCEGQDSSVQVVVTKADLDGRWRIKVEASFPVGISRQDAIRQTVAALEAQIKTEAKPEKEPQ